MNVKRLISLLQSLDPEESIVFQFLIAEHTTYSASEFEEIAEYLEDSEGFGEDTTRVLRNWCEQAQYDLEEEKEN
jgi:hypothetical protein